jgi:hypothetical protein
MARPLRLRPVSAASLQAQAPLLQLSLQQPAFALTHAAVSPSGAAQVLTCARQASHPVMGKAEDDALQSAAETGNVRALREAIRTGARLECKDLVRPLSLR